LIFVYTKAFANTPPRPYLDVILRNGFRTTPKLMALVDSGADYPIFPMEVAIDDLRLNLAEAPVWKFSGTTGKLQEARLADVAMSILEENDCDHAFEITATCAFCRDFKFAGGCLLGQNGFFSKFEARFSQSKNQFEIKPAEVGAPRE
jgi:hypothetical protein